MSTAIEVRYAFPTWIFFGTAECSSNSSLCLSQIWFSIQALCKSHPSEFASYFHYCRSLRFDDKPDYAYLKRIFRDLFIREGEDSSFYATGECEEVLLLLRECPVSWRMTPQKALPGFTWVDCWGLLLIVTLGIFESCRFSVWLCVRLDDFEISAISNCWSSTPISRESLCSSFILSNLVCVLHFF